MSIFSLYSVDGSPVFHGYNDYSDDDPLFRDYSIEINNNGCPECPCGRYEHEPMDIYALCEAMLKASNIKSALQSAYVSYTMSKSRELWTKPYFWSISMGLDCLVKFYVSIAKESPKTNFLNFSHFEIFADLDILCNT